MLKIKLGVPFALEVSLKRLDLLFLIDFVIWFTDPAG